MTNTKQKPLDITSMMLAPTKPGTIFPTTRALTRPRTKSNAMTRRERKTNFDLAYDEMLVEGVAQKAEIVGERSKDLSVAAARNFVDAAQEIWGIKLSVHEPALQQIVTLFCIEQIKMNGACQQEIAAIGTNMLIEIMQHSIEHQVEELPPTFWEWLTGTRRTDED